MESIQLEEPVPFRVLAVGHSGWGTSVIDLFEREVVTYHPGVLSVDRTDGAVAAQRRLDHLEQRPRVLLR